MVIYVRVVGRVGWLRPLSPTDDYMILQFLVLANSSLFKMAGKFLLAKICQPGLGDSSPISR